jgi:hypothetical protein
VHPLAEVLGGPDAGARAAMVMAQLCGFAILDQMIRPASLVEADRERLVALLAESLAACIDPPRSKAPRDAARKPAPRKRKPA